MKKCILFLPIILFTAIANAATPDTLSGKQRYFGFDANPILAQVLPLNRIGLETQFFSVMNRNYWGKFGLRLGYAANISDNTELLQLGFLVGFDFRRQLYHNWRFFTGPDMLFQARAGNSVFLEEEVTFGFGLHWGVEYVLNRVLSFSTETSLRFLVELDNGSSIVLQPPVNFMLHFNISRKK